MQRTLRTRILGALALLAAAATLGSSTAAANAQGADEAIRAQALPTTPRS